MNLIAKTRNGRCDTAVASRFSSLLTAHSALFTSFSPLFPRNPLFPASGPATRSFNGLHPKSNFLAAARVPGDGTAGPKEAAENEVEEVWFHGRFLGGERNGVA